MENWKVGDRLYDADYDLAGTVVGTDDDGVIDVTWDNGLTSDFTPNENTVKVPYEKLARILPCL